MRAQTEIEDMTAEVDVALDELGDSAPNELIAMRDTLMWVLHGEVSDVEIEAWIPYTESRK